LANFLKESYALAFDVLRVDDARTVAFLNQFVQPMLAINEWQAPQIFTVEPQQVESIEMGLPRRDISSLNRLTPCASRQTTSPSIIALCTNIFPSDCFRDANDWN
jgi:hypothetical protein